MSIVDGRGRPPSAETVKHTSTEQVAGKRGAAEHAAAKVEALRQRAPNLHGLDADVIERRNAAGRRALRGEPSAHGELRTPPKYFRTYEQVKAAISALQQKHPELVDVIDIGDSYEKTAGKADRDLLVMRLGASKTGKKPAVFYFGGQHAREISTPEMMMRFATWLVEGYGKDPEATALMDTREIHILPMFNPDGHAVIEKGYAGASGGDLDKRKNTSGEDGTDTNRNWGTKNWGTAGTTSDKFDETYSGPSPASEVEVRAVQSYVASVKPGLQIDWHSYSELVLYPPDDDASHTVPDQEHFVRVGKKFASFNGYTPEPSIDLYPTSGTSFWSYEKFGVPSFVVEVGTTFLQSDREYEDVWKRNFPVMVYGAKIADDWKKTSAGPDVSSAHVDAHGRLTAKAVDRVSGKIATAIEMMWDPQTPAGKGTPLAAHAGVFSLTKVNQAPELGKHGEKRLVYVRGRSADGAWGPLKPLWVTRAEPALRPVAMRAAAAAERRRA